MDLFVYGTLRDAGLRAAVAGDAGTVEPARLDGWAVRPLTGDVVPLLLPAPGEVADGLLWRGLTPAQADRLSLYEGAFGYRLTPVTVATDAGAVPAHVWLPPETAEAGAGDWSLADWQETARETAIGAAREIFAMDPPIAADALAQQFTMIQRRAWNRVEAARMAAPSRRRFDPGEDDVTVSDVVPPVGRFFRMQGFNVSHRRFDGGWQGPFDREVLVGTSAAVVIPFDPARGRLVLVEQVRMGPLMHGNRNPWMLEPAAGMIDPFETPETAALRETREESGLDVTLRRVAGCYPSPGNATDFFHLFVGLCDLPDDRRWTGGLASEHEDLRVHVLTLDEALDLADTGEIQAAPALALLWWIAANRERLALEFADGSAR